MKTTYGRRAKQDDGRTTRAVAATYGGTLNPMVSGKCNGGERYRVECPAEQLVAQMLELDPEVKSFAPQAITVDLVSGGLITSREAYYAARAAYRDYPGPCLYTGDFCVDIAQSARKLIEVRLDQFPGDDVYDQKIDRAKTILARFGWSFSRVIVPSDETRPVWWNVPLVSQAALRQDLRPTPEILDKIAVLHRDGARSARDYLSGLHWGINLLPVLLACGALTTDLLGEHFTSDTTVDRGDGDLSHLQIVNRLER